ADVIAALGLPEEVPHLASGARVDGPDVIGRREIQHAVQHQRRRLDGEAARWSARRAVGAFAADDGVGGRGVEAVDPPQRQVLHVARGDLLQRAEAAPGVVAVIGRPRVDGRLAEERGVELDGLAVQEELSTTEDTEDTEEKTYRNPPRPPWWRVNR